jgi:quercetin dioxygenase-like cupin family protein
MHLGSLAMNNVSEKMSISYEKITKTFLRIAPIVIVLAAVATSQSQTPHHGVVTPLGSAKLASDGQPACLKSALENGDPNTGPSTFLLEAAPGCVVPAHYHTAEEQLIVVRGDVLTGMNGMSEQTLGPGGFAMMPSKAMHWFTCHPEEACLMFVTFDRTYDITWAKPQK